MIDFEQIQLDYAECYADKTRIKFIEKFLSTFNASAGKMTPFTLFPRQKVFLKSLAENKASIAIKHRQCGITTISSAWMTGQCVFADPESPETILCIANKLEQANEIITKIRDFLLQVPRWFWGDDYFSVDPKSPKNTKDIFVKNSKSMLELFNGCKIYARASSANAARGISAVSILIFDEAAFIEEGLASYSSAVAATASQPNAKIIMVSTPNGKDELYYNTYKQALDKTNNYNAVEFRWYQDLRYNKNLCWYRDNKDSGEKEWIEEDVLDESGTVPYDEERWRKLEQEGWKPTNNWYVTMCKQFNNDSMKIAQELDVSFMGSANNVVEPAAIEMHRMLNLRDPLEELSDPMVADTWFWKAPIDGHRYILACLPEGEKVITENGLKNIEEVSNSDKLLTKRGVFANIKHRKLRTVTDEEIITVIPYGSIRGTTFTWNHPVWSSLNSEHKKNSVVGLKKKYVGYHWVHDFEYNDAKDLSKDCWLEFPNFYRLNEISEDNIKEKWIECGGEDGSVVLTEDFWWYCGMWLAEGYCKSNTDKIITVHNIRETSLHERMCRIIKTLFNRKGSIYHKYDSNSSEIYLHHKILYSFLVKNFGKYANGKHISEWIKFLPMKYKVQLFDGYYQGDGNFYNGNMYTTSVSLKLLEDFQDILYSVGIVSNIKKGKKGGECVILGKKRNSLPSYTLGLPNESTKCFNRLLNDGIYKYGGFSKYVYFSDDLNKIYLRIKSVESMLYSGNVYNFEVDDETHSFCCRNMVTHNCDPSRGDASDRTAIEIIDLDGIDEKGFPIVEQVAEFVGKKYGDEAGAMCVRYAKLYNNAFIIVDSTGGIGDALLLTIIQLGYKNIYYDDASQKSYTVQYSSKPLFTNMQDKLPGFHFQGNRYPVLSHFAGLVRNNEFKIRSVRVLNELETWIFKGDTGRMDHQSGAHDDTITCLAMGLFVMNYSLSKLESAKNKDLAILQAYTMGSTTRRTSYGDYKDSMDMSPKSNSLPFYTSKTASKYPNGINGSLLWLYGKMY